MFALISIMVLHLLTGKGYIKIMDMTAIVTLGAIFKYKSGNIRIKKIDMYRKQGNL